MRALILSGGFATRLRPLSCSKPKLLFPIVGVPLVERTFSWLGAFGISNVILAVNHMSDRIAMEVGKRYGKMKVTYSVEPYPLGTGGPIYLAKDHFEPDEPFLIINGDIVSNIGLHELVQLHVTNGAEATIAVVRMADPKPYGVAALDKNGMITRFVEKSPDLRGPAWINAGVYVLDPSIIRRIKPRKFVSLEREIFPIIAARSKMFGLKHQGFWYDIGNITDYARANMNLLKVRGYAGSTKKFVKQPSFVGKNCTISPSALLGPRTILSDGVKVGGKTRIRNSIVFENTVIGAGCQILDSIVGENVTLGDYTEIRKGTIVSGQIKIPSNSQIKPGSLVLN